MRVFIGLPIPPEATAWILQNRPPLLPDGARWIPTESWHLTLCFLGERTETQVSEIHRLVTPILQGHSCVALRPSHIGWKGRTLWVYLERSPLLEETVKCLHEVLDLPFTAPFVPHITIARSRVPLRWQSSRKVEPISFLFTVGYIYQSILRPEGATYKPLHRYLFKRPTMPTVF
ncbi:MAG: RNA 2',3'-cyclic phosphodiesterase [Bacteroidia bacterium]|nr:RNA 2',3'-cyclic phosphodiesterase [Bacteroidia bacterium]MCX7651583.1 RNA 2',3'-cyclic phosphodiesterase [Bacteroidia bacterium]MDW8417241.1 RNA 2',3'-cyclic phosphodiesterase [Bacteroidia bacterium]